MVFSLKAPYPNAVFCLPVVFSDKASSPIAVFLEPVVRASKAVNPTATFFIKNEIWPNFIKHAKMSGSKVYSVGGNFSSNYLKKLFKINSAIKEFDSVFVLNKRSKK